MKTFLEYLKVEHPNFLNLLQEKGWIQGAIDPEHKGYCTPMTKKTCTPRRKALAKRFKSGDLNNDKKSKKMG